LALRSSGGPSARVLSWWGRRAESGQRGVPAGGVSSVTSGPRDKGAFGHEPGTVFGDLVRHYRADAGLTQEELAERRA
jgi:hypothetical protein